MERTKLSAHLHAQNERRNEVAKKVKIPDAMYHSTSSFSL